MTAPEPARLDRRLRPTSGVLLLIGSAVADLLLLPFRVALAFCGAQRRQRDIAALIREKSPHAAQDPHPPR